MVVYIPMIAATTLLIWLAKHVKRNQRIVVLIMAIAIPVTVATLRYNNGADYLMYLRMMKLVVRLQHLLRLKVLKVDIGFY